MSKYNQVWTPISSGCGYSYVHSFTITLINNLSSDYIRLASKASFDGGVAPTQTIFSTNSHISTIEEI